MLDPTAKFSFEEWIKILCRENVELYVEHNGIAVVDDGHHRIHAVNLKEVKDA